MKPYAIPTDQLEQYTKSVHAEALEKKQDLSAPTCNDCHGNHGAIPPGVESVAEVCGTCHVRQAGLFEKSPHQPAFKAMQLASCVTCHGNHYIPYATDAMLGVGQNAVCIRCHTQGEPGYQAAQKMRAMIDQLSGRINQANQILETASSAGMEVSHPEFELTDAKGKLINARVVVHSFSPTQLQAAVDPGIKIANNAYEAGQAAMREHHVRRVGLAASLVVIFFAVLAIYFKVRQIEGREQ